MVAESVVTPILPRVPSRTFWASCSTTGCGLTTTSTDLRSVVVESIIPAGISFYFHPSTAQRPRRALPTSPKIPATHTKLGTHLQRLTGCQVSTSPGGGNTTTVAQTFLTSRVRAELRHPEAIKAHPDRSS